ncbi:hypothetical protein BDM02DRAFT_3241215, partial [Thelephora ganbajun]
MFADSHLDVPPLGSDLQACSGDFRESQCENVSIRFTANQDRDRCRWNLSTTDKVVIVIPGDGTQSYGRWDITVHCWDSGPLHRISNGSPVYSIPSSSFIGK